MCADTRLATIRVDGENVGSTPEGTDHHPTTIMAETDVLNFWPRSLPCEVYIGGGQHTVRMTKDESGFGRHESHGQEYPL